IDRLSLNRTIVT
ncbi:CPXV166 protein, partial [Monkeypox virus]